MKTPAGNIIFLSLLLLLIYLISPAVAGVKHTTTKKNASNSVLAEGNWIKIGITGSQVYKLDYDFFSGMGASPASLDPTTIKIFGNGCHMLPQENSVPRLKDLTENNIYVKGEEDGHFDPGDYVLFYGESPHRLALSDTSGTISVDYRYNLYSDTTYYFLTWGGTAGKRIPRISPPDGNSQPVTSYDRLEYHELNKTNILQSGREWYGEKFDLQTSYDFNFDFSGILPDSNLEVISSVMSQSFGQSTFDVLVNGTVIGTQIMPAIPDATYAVKGSVRTDDFHINANRIANPEMVDLAFRFNKASAGQSIGYLNYFIIHSRQSLIYRNVNFIYQSEVSLKNPVSKFEIREAPSGLRIWDITDPLKPEEMTVNFDAGTAGFKTQTSGLKTFIVMEDNNAATPDVAFRIDNQDLHGDGVPEFLIITHPSFLSQAERLASLRSSANGMSTLVVTTNQVYNEFSSGAQDITAIRDFIKYLYDKGGRTTLKYVLLFGKGSYDYKNEISGNTDFVPIYESRNSLHPVFSYASDDYYAFMDDNEGYWDETSSGDHTMDIAIGRIPARSQKEASIMVTKLENYETGKNRFGDWRSRICFVADDGDGIDGIIHERDADRLATLVDTVNSDYTVNKIYVDAYPQNLTPNSQTSPQARQAVLDAMNDGLFIINFTGHGNESQWTSEDVMDLGVITGFNNRYRLPLFVTATCEFGRHDNPRLISGAEYSMFNDRGGAIGLVTTSRPVFSSTNFILNEAFYHNLFIKEDNRHLALGEIFRRTKNGSLNGPINRNFSLLGDPSMKLAFPEYQAGITRINESDLENGSDTLQALKLTKVSGSISDPDGNEASDFNGTVTVTVTDKPVSHKTLGTQDPVMNFTERDNVIFRGDAEVKNGQYNLEFIVPKNINYKTGGGRINLYAENDSGSQDAIGSESRLKVGGTSPDAGMDDTPPQVEIFLYDSTWQQGDLTGPDPMLVIKLSDENGISTASYGLDKGITARLDDEAIDLTGFYKADVNDYKNGTINYQLNNLEKGAHLIEVSARDTYNNLGTGYLEFTVTDKRKLELQDLVNYPNPFNDQTSFAFKQNRAGDDLAVVIDIYDINGAAVRELNFSVVNSDYKVDNLVWNGTNATGKKLQSGLYIYKVTVRSLLDGAKNSIFRKLIINY